MISEKQSLTRRRFLRQMQQVAAGAALLTVPEIPAAFLAERILFLGDSITQAGGYVRAIDAALRAASPSGPPVVINRGKSSETVSGLSEAYHPGIRPYLFDRLDEELKAADPDWVVSCYGINCGIYHPFDEARFVAYQAGIQTLIDRVHAAGSRLVMLTAPPYAKPGPALPDDLDASGRAAFLAAHNQAANARAEENTELYGYRTPYAYYDRVMARYAAWLLTQAREGVWVVDLREAMLPVLDACYDEDPIHPNATGHHVMAEAFLEHWVEVINA